MRHKISNQPILCAMFDITEYLYPQALHYKLLDVSGLIGKSVANHHAEISYLGTTRHCWLVLVL